MYRKMSILGALAVLTMGVAVVSGVSHAQYIPPTGSVSGGSSATSTQLGDETTLTCEAMDLAGDPIEGAACTFSIVSEPGGPNGDAAVGSKVVTKLTNAQGIATTMLYVGTTPGVIIVEVQSGDFTSEVLVTVEGEAASPPQSDIQPPATGSGGLAH